MRAARSVGHALVWGAFILALAATAARLLRHAPNYYGTARAPYSDSLTNWVQGALDLYFSGESAAVLLFRPTVPVLFSSVFALSGDLAAIPAVFIAAAVLGASAAFLLSRDRDRPALALLAATLALCPAFLLDSLNPDSLNTELPAFAFGLTGLLLLGCGLKRADPMQGAALFLVSGLLIGIVAAIRGTIMASIPALALFGAWILWRRRGPLRPVAALAFVAGCAVTYGIDVYLVGLLEVRSPGLMPLFAVYWDPSHLLTNEAYFAYVEQAPSGGTVLRTYLAYLASAEGIRVMANFFAFRLIQDSGFVGQPLFAGVALAAFAIERGLALRTRRTGETPFGSPTRLAVLAATVALPVVVPGPLAAALFVGILAIILVEAVVRPLPFAGLFVLAYLGGMSFLVLTGTATYDRVLVSFLFCPHAAILWFLLERRETFPVEGGAGWPVAGAVAAVLAVLYLANPLVDTPLKRRFEAEVRGRPAAIKISDDPRLDRSLYYGSGTELLYTRSDGRPIGTVRPLGAFVNPAPVQGAGGTIDGARMANGLFEAPGHFTD